MDQPKRPSKIRLIAWISVAVLFVGGIVSMLIYKSNRDAEITAIEKLVPGSKAREEVMTRVLSFNETDEKPINHLMKSVDLVFDESVKEIEGKLMGELSKSGWILLPRSGIDSSVKAFIFRKHSEPESPDQFDTQIYVSRGNLDEDGEIERDPNGKSTIVTITSFKIESFMDAILPIFFLEKDAKLSRDHKVVEAGIE